MWHRSFDEIFHTEGIKVARTPVRTPVANCYLERWIGSVRRELVDRTIIWNERQLRRLADDYILRYNQHRPHRSLGQQQPPHTSMTAFRAGQPITDASRCNGLIHEYRQVA
jgi:transposase InsO family protein